MLTIGLVMVGMALLWRHLSTVDWPAMTAVLQRLPRRALWHAALFASLSYAIYCSFDLLGQRTAGHPLHRWRVLGIAFVGHACALSLGPAGAGVRFRLAMRHGLPAHLVAALWLFNVATNWLGFVVIAGVAFVTQAITWPERWGIDPSVMRLLGAVLLAVVAAYLAACRIGHQMRWHVRGVDFRLPPLPVALAQCGLSACNWVLLAAVVHAFLPDRITLFDVLGALMASALALAVVDVPAGLGITETVFVTLLGGQAPAAEILAALVAYRAIYFLAPLLLASAVYLALEWDAHRRRRDDISESRSLDERSRLPAPAARRRSPNPREPAARRSPP